MAKSKKEKEASTQVVTTPKPGALAIPVSAAEWGMDQELTAQDILIPQILVMQGLSKLVVEGDAKFGEARNSVTKKLLGTLEKPFEIVPFYMQKTLVVMTKGPKEKSFKWVRSIPITPELENQEFETKAADGTLTRWYRTYNFYVLFPEEITAGNSLPHILSFRSSSIRAGKTLATQMFTTNLRANKSPAAQVMRVVMKKRTNDDGTFVVLEVEPVRDSTDAEVLEAYNWVKVVRSGKVKIDEAAEEDHAVTATSEVVAEDSGKF